MFVSYNKNTRATKNGQDLFDRPMLLQEMKVFFFFFKKYKHLCIILREEYSHPKFVWQC